MDLKTLRGRILIAVITLAALLAETACLEPPAPPTTTQGGISTPVSPQTESSAGNAAAPQSTRQRILTTPEPTSTPLPAATPKPAAGLRLVELDSRYRPVYVHGREYAAIGPGDRLYIVNVETGERIQVTDDELRKYEAAFSARHVAWVDHRRKMELHYGVFNPPSNTPRTCCNLVRPTEPLPVPFRAKANSHMTPSRSWANSTSLTLTPNPTMHKLVLQPQTKDA